MTGEGRRTETATAGEEIAPHPEITLREISGWSLAILAAVAFGFVLYAAREIMLPVVAAFVVGVMLGPAARKLETLHIPRPLVALILVAGVTLIIALVILLIFPRVSELATGLPGIIASLKDKLHVFDGLVAAWRRLMTAIGESSSGDAAKLPLPGISWVPSTLSVVLPTITEFLFFLVVLLLFISGWPDLRRGLVMTFASRDSRLTALKILNEIESGLGAYLLIVTLINLAVGTLTGILCALTGMPNAAGFGALAATLNFIPVVGPMAMFVVLLLVGLVAEPTIIWGLAPAAGFLLVITVEGQFLTPAIIGRHLELNALAVLLSLAFWTWLWGPMGAFLSSPILMVALILRQRLYIDEDPRIASSRNLSAGLGVGLKRGVAEKRMTSDIPSEGERRGDTRHVRDDAFARLEKEMAAMKNAIGGLSDQIADAASDIGAVAQEQAKRGLKHARANVGSLAADASDRLGVVAGTAQSQASSLAETLEDAVRERPLSTVALALGFGFLAGIIWRR